jgi:hypothetical protein
VNRSTAALSWATALLPLVAGAGLVGLVGAVLTPWLLALTGLAVASIIGFGVAVAASVPVDRHEPAPGRLRALVGVLHVLQPLVRTWGRLVTRRPAVEPAPRPWTGDRPRWLADLETDLRAARLPVGHLDAASEWDLEVRTGLFGRLLVVTGVAWRWTPQIRAGFRLRPWGAVPVLAVVAALAWSPTAALVAGGVVGTEVAVELVRLRRARSIVARSTAGAEPARARG